MTIFGGIGVGEGVNVSVAVALGMVVSVGNHMADGTAVKVGGIAVSVEVIEAVTVGVGDENHLA